jgi:hypothetical protein
MGVWHQERSSVVTQLLFGPSEGAHIDKTATVWKQQKSGLGPQKGLDTKTDRPADRRSWCDFDFDYSAAVWEGGGGPLLCSVRASIL